MSLLKIPVLLSLGFLALSITPLPAQTMITCSSENGKRNYCAADTRGGVTLQRQRSGSPCQQNVTWGYDGRGIWVDRGCRADFVIRRAGMVRPPRPGIGPGGPGMGRPPQLVNCSSEDGRRKYCPVDTSRGVVLVKQRSGSSCRQGSTWGYDRRGIWVDRGCRADFQVR